VARTLPTHRTSQIQKMCERASMPGVGLEPTIPVFEGAMKFSALELAASVNDLLTYFSDALSDEAAECRVHV
jgi:hypothetical protein